MAETLPKEQLLLKMLNMTTSDNDGQALVAIRKSNELLASAGWSWEKLLSGKITVVADPFARMPEVKRPEPEPERAPARSAPQPRGFQATGASTGRWSASPPPPPPKAKISSMKNMYPGYCWVCGTHVNAQDGWAFKPRDLNSQITHDKHAVVCQNDNSARFISPSAAPRKKSTLDIHASINPTLNQL